jgi:hypothetical protein
MSAQSHSDADGIMGCREVEPKLGSWTEFVSKFALEDAANRIFRGQGDATWPLSTTLQRALETRRVEDPSYRAHVENSSIGFFKDRSRLHLPTVPDEQDLLGWLALMQHYGAPTRLQDWTLSPFVAAYFAYREDPKADDGSTISTNSHLGKAEARTAHHYHPARATSRPLHGGSRRLGRFPH